jgi:flagellar biosynthesis/type III secretory pathway protein FliH
MVNIKKVFADYEIGLITLEHLREEMEALEAEAYEAGRSDGQTEGYDEGYADGKDGL